MFLPARKDGGRHVTKLRRSDGLSGALHGVCSGRRMQRMEKMQVEQSSRVDTSHYSNQTEAMRIRRFCVHCRLCRKRCQDAAAGGDDGWVAIPSVARRVMWGAVPPLVATTLAFADNVVD